MCIDLTTAGSSCRYGFEGVQGMSSNITQHLEEQGLALNFCTGAFQVSSAKLVACCGDAAAVKTLRANANKAYNRLSRSTYYDWMSIALLDAPLKQDGGGPSES